MSNQLITPQKIARETLAILTSEVGIADAVYRDYEAEFTSAKVGDMVTIKAPATFTVKNFNGVTEQQPIVEKSVQLKLTEHFDLTIPVTAKEMTLELQSFSEQVLRGVAVAFSEKLDNFVYENYKDIYNFIGTAGSPPSTVAQVTDIDRIMNELRIPMRDRMAFIDPLAKSKLLQIEAVHRADARGDGGTALEMARIGNLMNLNFFMGQNVARHTAGTQGATAGMTIASNAVKGATSLSIQGAQANATFVQGDLFTIAGVTLDSKTTTPAMFVVTSDVAANGSGAVTLPFYPELPSNVSSGVAVTAVASHRVNMAFVKQAIALAVVPLDLPMGTDKAAMATYGGMGIRVVQQYDSARKLDTISFDCLAGQKVIDPRLALRVLG